MHPQAKGGKIFYPNGPGHITKLAAMPTYGKNLLMYSSPEPVGWYAWNFVCSTRCFSVIKIV